MNVYIEPEQKERLEAISKKTGAPVAELIRRAINLFTQDPPCGRQGALHKKRRGEVYWRRDIFRRGES
jgi:hypothetical protein